MKLNLPTAFMCAAVLCLALPGCEQEQTSESTAEVQTQPGAQDEAEGLAATDTRQANAPQAAPTNVQRRQQRQQQRQARRQQRQQRDQASASSRPNRGARVQPWFERDDITRSLGLSDDQQQQLLAMTEQQAAARDTFRSTQREQQRAFRQALAAGDLAAAETAARQQADTMAQMRFDQQMQLVEQLRVLTDDQRAQVRSDYARELGLPSPRTAATKRDPPPGG